MTELVTDKCPCCGTRGLNPKKIKDMCENCLETSFDQWRRKVVSLEKENTELRAKISELKQTESEDAGTIANMASTIANSFEQIEKMKCCGNCKHAIWREDNYTNLCSKLHPTKKCDKWEFLYDN